MGTSECTFLLSFRFIILGCDFILINETTSNVLPKWTGKRLSSAKIHNPCVEQELPQDRRGHAAWLSAASCCLPESPTLEGRGDRGEEEKLSHRNAAKGEGPIPPYYLEPFTPVISCSLFNDSGNPLCLFHRRRNNLREVSRLTLNPKLGKPHSQITSQLSPTRKGENDIRGSSGRESWPPCI